jgi:hypothetical protein
MVQDEMKHKLVRGELLFQVEARLEEDAENKLRKWIREARKEFGDAETLNPSVVASLGPLRKSYVFYRQLSSDAAHPSIDALGRYVKSFHENGERIRGIDVEPVVGSKEIAETLNWACLAMISVCAGANQILEYTDGGRDLELIANEYVNLTNSNAGT